MMPIEDPGAGLPDVEARAARLAAWARPADAAVRRAERELRVADWMSGISQLFLSRGAVTGYQVLPASSSALLEACVNGAPGETYWLQEGVYRGLFTVHAQGTLGSPVSFRAIPGQRVVIDGGFEVEAGHDVIFHGLEITNSQWVSRVSNYSGSKPPDMPEVDGFNIGGPRVDVVNCFIHDTPQAIGCWGSATGCRIEGNVIVNNGWQGPDRGHGHGVYLQNADGAAPKLVRRNVFLNNYGWNVHVYAEQGPLDGFTFERNVSVNRTWLVGGDSPVDNVLMADNHVYRGAVQFGSAGLQNGTGTLLRNRWNGSAQIAPWSSLTAADNGPQEGARVEVIPDSNERNRAVVVVYNPEGEDFMGADLSGVAGSVYDVKMTCLETGEEFRFSPADMPVVPLPMKPGKVVVPVAAEAAPFPATLPHFGVFTLEGVYR